MAYGGSQASGPVGATAAGLYHRSRQHWILNPLSEVRDRTWVSWLLVRFVSAEPRELLKGFFFFFFFFGKKFFLKKSWEKKISFHLFF